MINLHQFKDKRDSVRLLNIIQRLSMYQIIH